MKNLFITKKIISGKKGKINKGFYYANRIKKILYGLGFSEIYGYTFAKTPEDHQPSGTANMSRATSVTLNLRVNHPIAKDLSTLSPPCIFDTATVGGWEVFVFAIHYNWLRFDNGICNRMFTD